MVQQNIIERIAALLRLAEHPNSNEHEASLAMEKAQALLLEHNLSRASLNINGQEPEEEGIGKVEVQSDTGVVWKITLLNVVAKANLCHVVAEQYANKAHLFGTKTNVVAVLGMYDWIREQLEEMGLRAWTTYKTDGGRENARTWKAAFHAGAATVLRQRLAKPLDEFTKGKGNALVLYNDKALDRAVHQVFPHLSKSHRTVNYTSAGYGAGQTAGHNVRLGRSAALGGARAALNSGR